MSYEVDPPTELAHQTVYVPNVVPEVVEAASADVLREAVASMVRGKDFTGELLCNSVPRVPLLEVAVQQQDRGSRGCRLSPRTHAEPEAP